MGKVTKDSLEVYKWLKRNASKVTVYEAQEQIKKEFGKYYTEDALWQRCRRAGLKFKDHASTNLKGHIKKIHEKHEIRREKKHLDDAVTRIKELEAHVEAIKKLQSATGASTITPTLGTGTSEATAIAVATDWHCGERIVSAQVNGLNEFSVSIFKDRAAKFFERVVRLTEKERQDVHIENLILFLGGDF